jgi:hypothetical protein
MKYVLYILLFLSQTCLAQSYFGTGLGYTRYTFERGDGLPEDAFGPTLGLKWGYRFGSFGVEPFFNYTKVKSSNIVINSEKYIHNAKIFSLGSKIYYQIEFLQLHLGYAYHKFNSYVTNTNSGSVIASSDIMNLAGVKGNKSYFGPIFGMALEMQNTSIAPYVSFTSHQLNAPNASLFEAEMGLKFRY